MKNEKNLKKNNKKKRMAVAVTTIAFAFVIAIATTFGLTMAWFGGHSSTGANTVTLKAGITVGTASVTNFNNVYVVPSQPISGSCTLTVSPTSSKADSHNTNALLRAKVTFTSEVTGVSMPNSFTVTGKFTDSKTTAYLVKNGDYYYLAPEATVTTSTVLTSIDLVGNASVTLSFPISITIPDTLKNDSAGKTISLTIEFVAIQDEIYKSGTKATNTITNTTSVFDAVAAY